MPDVKLLTDKYVREGLSLERANERAYREAHAAEQPSPGGSEHLRMLSDGAGLTLVRGQLRPQIDMAAETKRLMSEGMTLEQANNAVYLMSTGAAPKLYASPDSLTTDAEKMEAFLLQRQQEDKAQHDSDQAIATRPTPTFEQCMAQVKKEFPKLLPSRQARLAADLLDRLMLPPGGKTDMNSYNNGNSAA